MLQQRKMLNENQFSELNNKILAFFIQLDLAEIKSIHIFLPIIKNNEPNTFLIINWLTENRPDIQIIVSRSDFAAHSMSNHPFLGLEDLAVNRYGIPEPQTEKIFTRKPDMVLVPLLAFDKRGYRVGYGKGFYDRFLSDKQSKKVGISIFDSIMRIDDIHKDDIRLD